MTQSDHYLKTLKNAMIEISNSKTRMAAEREQIKAICDHVKEEIQVESKKVKKLANIYYNQNLTKLVGETEEIAELYEEVMKSK
jgi:radical SAM superfamily enzyme